MICNTSFHWWRYTQLLIHVDGSQAASEGGLAICMCNRRVRQQHCPGQTQILGAPNPWGRQADGNTWRTCPTLRQGQTPRRRFSRVRLSPTMLRSWTRTSDRNQRLIISRHADKIRSRSGLANPVVTRQSLRRIALRRTPRRHDSSSRSAGNLQCVREQIRPGFRCPSGERHIHQRTGDANQTPCRTGFDANFRPSHTVMPNVTMNDAGGMT